MSKPIKKDDPAYFLLEDGFTSKRTIFKKGCYICEDPEFALMGLPLCYRYKFCNGHIPADSDICDDCGKQVNHNG